MDHKAHKTSRIVLLALALSACRGPGEEHDERPTLHVTSPLREDTTLAREYVGQIRAKQHIEIRALERGYLEEIFVDEGQVIQANQPMFQIMPRIYQAEVKKEAAEAKRAEIELSNTKLLADQNVVSPNELALARVNLTRAKAELELAKAHRGLTEIHAPFTGIMGRFQARQGSLLEEGDPLTTLSDNSVVWVYFNMAERDYLHFMATRTAGEQQVVHLRMANGEIFPRPGVIETIEADFDNETGTIAFRAAFENPDGLLRHGQTGKVILAEKLDKALIIPQKATFDILDRKFVYVVDAEGRVASRPIKVRAELPQIFVIEEGLKEEDHILLDGLRNVHEGSVIHPDFSAPADVVAHLEVRAE